MFTCGNASLLLRYVLCAFEHLKIEGVLTEFIHNDHDRCIKLSCAPRRDRFGAHDFFHPGLVVQPVKVGSERTDGMSVQSSLFDNVMTDMSGKIRLDGEDPRWIQLFSLRNVSKLLTKKEVAWYGNRLIENNIMTGKLVQLLDQTATRLQQITPRRTAPPGQLLDQCCSALFISALLLHHLAASLPATEVTFFS